MTLLESITSEFYYRSVWFIRKLVDLPRNSRSILSGRTEPLIIRPEKEEFKIPANLSGHEALAFITLLITYFPEDDYSVSKVVNHYLKVARKYKYQGKWEWCKNLIEYFDFSKEDEIKQREFVLFSLPDYFDFLLTIRSEDDLFGNLYRKSARLSHLVKIKKIVFVTEDKRPVFKPQFHRGYKDHGHLPKIGARELREANRQSEKPELPRYNSDDQVVTYFHPSLREGGD